MSLNLCDIHPLSEFQRSAKAFLATLEQTQAPMVLTVNGKAAVVVQSAESYQNLLERVEQLEVMAGLRQSLGEFDQGLGIPLDQAFQTFNPEHGGPD